MKRVLTIISAFLLTFCFAAEVYAQTYYWSGEQDGGTYYGVIELTGDVTLKSRITIAQNTSLTIDLKGHTITFTNDYDRVFLCDKWGELTIKDSSSGKTGVITGGVGDRGGFCYLLGKFNFLGGTIKNAHAISKRENGDNVEHYYTDGVGGAVYVQTGAEFIMDGGNIENCCAYGYTWSDDFGTYVNGEYHNDSRLTGWIPHMGGAVFINGLDGKGGLFHFKSGTIRNCFSGAGGAVCVHVAQKSDAAAGSVGEFIMDGGEISNCNCDYVYNNYNDGGGAVFVAGNTSKELAAKFTMNGGTISNCTSATHGGGIRSQGIVEMHGGTIKNGNAVRGGGVFVTGVTGQFKMTGGSIEDCIATRNYADNNTKERIFTNGAGGGVFVELGGYFEMHGGTIRKCSTSSTEESMTIATLAYPTNRGGGVFVSAYAGEGAANISNPNNHSYRGRFWFNKGRIENCESGVGGGVCVHTTVTRNIAGANGRFTMESGAEIRNCKSKYPPGNDKYGGGGVFIAGNGTVDGGLKGVFNMRGGRITACTAIGNGGGVKCNGEMNMADGCVIDRCSCVGGIPESYQYSHAYGGGIHLYNATFDMTGGTIKNDTAFSGGGVMAWGTKCVFTMNGANAIISDNFVSGVNGSGNGGGVYVQEATFNFDRGTITRNIASRYGGGININKTATLNLNGICHITYNKANSGGALSQEAGGCVIDIKSDGVLIEGNIAKDENTGYESWATARGQGGGILIEKGTFRMSKGKIINNTASDMGGGVSCYVRRILGDVTAEISGGEISGNSAGISGGGINLYADRTYNASEDELNGDNHLNDVKVKLTGGILCRNSVKNGDGGGIYVYVNEENSIDTMTIETSYTESTIYGNTVTGNGGAIGLSNGTVIVKSGNFSNNTAGNGGAIYLGDGDMSMNNIYIHGNTATKSGGGVYLANGTLTIEDADKNKIINNTAESTGGGIQVQDGDLKMEKCLVQENNANYGGGVCVNNSNPITINLLNPAIDFEKNTATTAGGGMAVLGKITLNFSGSLQHNTASNGGGIFVAQGAKLIYKGGMIRYNHATGTSTGINTGYEGTANGIHGFGGGVFVGSDSKLAFDVTEGGLGFYGNDANTGGDDIFANGKGTDVLLPVVGEMELTGFNIPVAKNGIFWVEDYMTSDVEYDLGTIFFGESHTPIRYRDALKSAAVVGRLEDNDTYYTAKRSKYLSIALGYELLFVRIVKQGLAPGDAAIVNVSYSKTGEISSIDSDWVQHQKALLVGPESGDASVIVALPPNAWKFEEETAWSENYTAEVISITEKFSNQEQVKDVTFKNTKKAKSDITVHDEENVENRMRPTL